MKKLLAISLSLIMLFAVMPMTILSVSAENYNYYSIFSADTDELPILYRPGEHVDYEIVDDTVRNDDGKIVKVTKKGQWMNEPNIAFKQDFSQIAKDSVGIRVFVAKSDDALAGNLVIFGFGSTANNKVYTDTGIWGAPNSGNVTTEGSWYELYWNNTTGLSEARIEDNTASNNGYRLFSSSQTLSTDNKIDADFISGMDSIYIKFNLTSSTGYYSPAHYFFDDVQFIYPEGKGPSSEEPSEEDGTTTDALTVSGKASIRLGTVSGIRFYTAFDESKIDGEVVEKGTLIGPKDLIGTYLTDADVTADNAVMIPYKADTLWENNEFVGSIVGIKDTNYNREFAARAYVKLSDGTYLYSADTTVKTVADIADAFIADANSDYNTGALSEELKNLVDAWSSANN